MTPIPKCRRPACAARSSAASACAPPSACSMPLGTKVFGSLFFLSWQTDRFSEDDVDFARRVADHLALALSHEQLAEAARREAESRETAARLEAQVATLTRELESRTGHRRVVGQSKQWKDVLAHAARVAHTETTVLLTGESGTGKEVVARFIHHASRRSQRTVCRDQLRGASRPTARVRALRSRARRLHRRRGCEAWPHRTGERRRALPRRGRRDGADRPGQAAARARRARVHAARQHTRCCMPTFE